MDYVFSLGLIPVQEFISEARRSRDLRAGSAILSFMTAQILNELKKDLKADIIIPAPDSFEKIASKTIEEVIADPKYSIPNRASGYLSVAEKINLKDKLNDLESKFIEQFWQEQCRKEWIKAEIKKYFESIPINYESPFQLIWVAVPVGSDFESRTKANKVLEDLEMIAKVFDNVKITRPIKPWIHGAPIGKCTQCGKREAISPKEINFQDWWKWYQGKVKHIDIQLGYRFEKSERLCSVCIVKRLLSYEKEDHKFPSTNVIASKYWFKKLSQNWENKHKLEYKSFEKLLKEIKEDPELIFFRRNHKEIIDKVKQKGSSAGKEITEKIKKNGNNVDKNKMKNFCRDIAKFIKEAKLPIAIEPSDYLSIITYDGDNMGEKVQKYWKSVPEQLYIFQNKVHELIEENSAKAYYIGGDEGLILCPIETTLKLAVAIRNEFMELFEEIDPEMTLSMGITIFDRERPMSAAIKHVQEVLKIAKRMDGKNALAVGVQTASGNQWYFVAQWGTDWKRIQKLLSLISQKDLSKSWAYDVENFIRNLDDKLMTEKDMAPPILTEMKRITTRKYHPQETNGRKIKECLEDLWSNELFGDTWLKSLDDYLSFSDWANQFHFIGFLSRFNIEK